MRQARPALRPRPTCVVNGDVAGLCLRDPAAHASAARAGGAGGRARVARGGGGGVGGRPPQVGAGMIHATRVRNSNLLSLPQSWRSLGEQASINARMAGDDSGVHTAGYATACCTRMSDSIQPGVDASEDHLDGPKLSQSRDSPTLLSLSTSLRVLLPLKDRLGGFARHPSEFISDIRIPRSEFITF